MVHTHLPGLRFLLKYTSQECSRTDISSKKIMLKQQEVIILNIPPGPVQAFPLQYIYLYRNIRLLLLALTCGWFRLSVSQTEGVFNTKADGFKQQESSLGRLQEEVLDTPGLPDLQGGATVSTFIQNSDSNINAKWLKANPAPRKGEHWGSGGQRVGEGETGERRGARYQESRSSLISCICAIKEITASDEGNCKGTRITFLYIVRGGSQEEQSKGNERQLSQGCEGA